MNKNERDKLIRSWIFAQKLGINNPGYEKHSWAVDRVINLAIDDPEELWEIIFQILELDNSEQIIKAVGAGPLEDLMVQHGEIFIDRVEKQASKSEVFKSAMCNVWLDNDDTKIYAKFFEIAGIEPPYRK
jgi:hypothetical protein